MKYTCTRVPVLSLRVASLLTLVVACSGPSGDGIEPIATQQAALECPPTSADAWAAGISYATGAYVSHGGHIYRCLQGHTSQATWAPPDAPALWEIPTPCGTSAWTPNTAYVTGSLVTFDGSTYECIQGHTSQVGWEPPQVPALWRAISDVPETCLDVYPTNDRDDETRFNLVFVGYGFDNDDDVAVAARRMLDVDGSAFAQTGANGLFQVPVLKNAFHRFNVLYVTGSQPFANFPPSQEEEVDAFFARLDSAFTCQDEVPNRIIPIFLHPEIPNGQFESFGRQSAVLSDCHAGAPTECELLEAQQGVVHELMHTVICLTDEYGRSGDGGTEPPVPFNGQLSGMSALQLWAGDSYAQCLEQAPWSGEIGNGCGAPGVVDCFKPECIDASSGMPIFNRTFRSGTDIREDCCLPGQPNCISEVACFQGGLAADTGIFRATAGGVMRTERFTGYTPANYLGYWQSQLVDAILQKGPAIGLHWDPNPSFERDCDPADPGFEPDP